jgi:beta-phosphoglucomutase-like phosphatase (HAD superfamily)
MTDLLDASCSVPSDDMPRGKPNPDGYLLALERCGVTAAEVAAFEDSRVGSTAALAAGIERTFVCPPPSAPNQDYPPGAIRVSTWDELFPAS